MESIPKSWNPKFPNFAPLTLHHLFRFLFSPWQQASISLLFFDFIPKETKIEQEITAKVDTKVKVDPKKKQKNKAKNDHGETVIDQGYCLCWKN
ncbi:hypothetical protein P8452_60470 [Trifolium repens]|nr:hypothetical protein P8452_60470 [Trifolium repens]